VLPYAAARTKPSPVTHLGEEKNVRECRAI
jgi:hypothetical protein